MARYLDASCKRCRREQMKLFLKGSRCYSNKCPIEREAPPPGMHGFRRGKISEYGLRLREKQKLKFFYGILETQFRRYYAIAARSPDNTGEQLLSLLERRLDNVIHRLGFAPSRKAARQMISHKHILINDWTCNVPSRMLRVGDMIKVKVRQKSLNIVKMGLQESGGNAPDFMELTPGDQPEARMIRIPSRADVDPNIREIREQLIIEIATR